MLRSLARSGGSLQWARALHQQAVEQLTALLGERGVTTDPVALSAHNSDWTNVYKGEAKVVVSPSCTEEVSRVLAHCHKHHISVVPQGGNTGLVGGGIAFSSEEVVLSLSRMNKILDFQGVCHLHQLRHSEHLNCGKVWHHLLKFYATSEAESYSGRCSMLLSRCGIGRTSWD